MADNSSSSNTNVDVAKYLVFFTGAGEVELAFTDGALSGLVGGMAALIVVAM